ncbi:MAG: NAD-dependent epimerase/dehydratase family protein [Bacteroidetes bacterium]|nr:NAD-dependent epimerase/dehydratase family protein [Bacteroidota bacterium]
MTSTAFVTGASGFIGRRVVDRLLRAGIRVRAGVRHPAAAAALPLHAHCETVEIDVSDPRSLVDAMRGADTLYHFAAAVTSRMSAEQLLRINAEGTHNVWMSAADAGIRRALYCSSTAVYGLLSQNGRAVTEAVLPRAVEPYGRSKLLGEEIARRIGAERGVDTIVIRPTAVFGSGEHTHFGGELRNAALSRILLGGGFRNRHFSFVHVDDVAGAAIHVMQLEHRPADVFNVVVEPAISYEDAFQMYRIALGAAGGRYWRQRLLAALSVRVERRPGLARWLHERANRRVAFSVWRPGFDMTYSSESLRATDYRFLWTDFSAVLRSCMNE